MSVLANLIFTFHLCIVIFVIFGFLSQVPMILLLHITFIIGLISHWAMNSDICSLSVMEAQCRGINYTETFMHRCISPIYNIHEYQLTKLCYIVSITGLAFSLYNLYNSERFRLAIQNCKEKGLFDHETMQNLAGPHSL